MKLIREYLDASDCDILVEESFNNMPKNYKIAGPYLSLDTKNQNGRTYPTSNVKPELDRIIAEAIPKGSAIGELNHPHKVEVNLENICHKIIGMEYVGKDVIGTSQVCSKGKGEILRGLIDDKIPFGVSLRAVGTLKNNVMQSDFRLIAVDVVHNPSFPNAMMDFILESKEEYFVDEQGNILPKVKELEVIAGNKRDVDYKNKVLFALNDFFRSL